ncbi:hypothetical protein [Nitrosomonas sp.]|uniref:hypothetical protein n=1 Tax=Nitrosomonas sp. TaxID=42353 RepID=UPI0026365701|nr:hypothetical protein [Nitrosomonas sp.]MCW5602578.1 hypothetical protein [Nitrosomonas sp.]
MTVLDKLFRYLPKSVYATSPDAVVAMRIRANDNLTWQVIDKMLTVTADDVALTYTLADKTLSELSTALQADGVSVVYLNTDEAARGAICLIEGSGDQDQSNGDSLLAHRNLLWDLFGAYAEELVGAKMQLQEALKQMVIEDAEGFWLDLWGALYGALRRDSESDANFSLRLPLEIFRQRVNPRAIELAIRELTGKNVRIEESWQNIARWDQSLLDGADRFYDGDFIGYHLIQPVAEDPVVWSEIMPIVHRNRPTGVLVLPPATKLLFQVDATGHEIAAFSLHREFASEMYYQDKLIWDFSYFGDMPIPNRESLHFRQILRYSRSIYDDSIFDAEVFHIREFRETYMEPVIYMRQTWSDDVSWGDVNESWEKYNEVDAAIHIRS